VRECGEDLVDLAGVASLRLAGHPAGPDVRLRATVVDRLVTAQSLMPRSWRLLVIQGYLPPSSIRPGVTDGTVLHVTGGAVDLSLCTRFGAAVPMGGFVATDDEVDRVAAANRRILSESLTSAGLFDLPDGWWHWSYGDAYWCRRAGAPAAVYGPVPG
jgi:D-alanyl-D-alanine dipeptidase